MRKILKTPSDYDQFYFRIDSKTKNSIEDQVVSILNYWNEKKKPEEKLKKRNEIIAQALLIGLKAMTKVSIKKIGTK